MINGKMPAMPLPLGTETEKWCQGLTKREMMAMHVMAGYVSNSKAGESGSLMCIHDVASYSVECADALLAELERTK